MNFEQLPVDLARNRVVGTEIAATYVGMDVQAFRRAIKNGAVPSPIMLGERKRGWRLGELSDWVAARAAERGAA